MCSRDGRTTNSPCHFDRPVLKAFSHLDKIVVRASRLHISNLELGTTALWCGRPACTSPSADRRFSEFRIPNSVDGRTATFNF
jgi:hypothetical protein